MSPATSARNVLVTGGNGFVAQHIISQLLEGGHRVRAVVRTQPKADQLLATFTAHALLETFIVPDITAPSAFDQALTSTTPIDVVIHTASPFNYRAVSSNREFLDPAIRGTTEILSSIARVAPSVKRVVMTSSMAAVIDWGAPKVTHPAKVYTSGDWNPISWDEALSTTSPNVAYCASKTFAEKAAWEFVAQRDHVFDLVTINPPMVYGPYVDPTVYKTPQALNQSNFNLWQNFLKPGLSSSSPVPPTGLHLFVDVRDLARAHVLAATKPETGGKRFVIGAGGISNEEIAGIFRDALPQLADRIPKEDSGAPVLSEGLFALDSAEAEAILGLEFSNARSTFRDVALQLMQIAENAEVAP